MESWTAQEISIAVLAILCLCLAYVLCLLAKKREPDGRAAWITDIEKDENILYDLEWQAFRNGVHVAAVRRRNKNAEGGGEILCVKDRKQFPQSFFIWTEGVVEIK